MKHFRCSLHHDWQNNWSWLGIETGHTIPKTTAMLRNPNSNPNRRKFLHFAGLAASGAALSGLAGCSREATVTQAPPGTGPLKNKRVGVSSPHKVEILNEFYEDMKREARRPENQLEVVVVDAGGDAVKQLSDIEAFIAQNYDGIFFLALPSEGLERLVARALAKSIFMFNHGASPITGATQNVVLDQHFTGAEIGKFAAQWINEKKGGRAEVGILGNSSDPWLTIRTQGLKDGLREHAPGAKIAGEVHGHSIELGAAGAANLLQAHPGITVLLAHADDPGYGCFTAATEAGKRDPIQFLVASCDGTRLVMDKVAEGGIYQATWSYLFPFSATAWMRDMIRCLRGQKVPPTRTQVGRLVTKANVDDIRALTRDPRSPEAQKYYDDPTVMRYSDELLRTPKA
jgi:ribose transport system substrate-binding protein